MMELEHKPPETEEEIDAYLRLCGYDPKEVARWGKEIATLAMLKVREARVKRLLEWLLGSEGGGQIMELERMRQVLATKCMEWTAKILRADALPWYMYEGCPVMPIRGWTPDEDWQQCGMVIEAMREKGWGFGVSWRVNDKARITLWQQDMPDFWYAEGDFCYAVSLAAARALETEKENE